MSSHSLLKRPVECEADATSGHGMQSSHSDEEAKILNLENKAEHHWNYRNNDN